jgi:hypothetical protein
MKVFISFAGGTVWVHARPEGDGIIGDVAQPITRGESFLGHGFDDLIKLGEGEHELTEAEQ